MSRAHDFYNADDEARWGRSELPEQFGITAGWLSRLDLPAGPVAELGCGKGAMREIDRRYVGLDFSLPALTRMDAGARRVNGDMQSLPYRDGSLAAVFSWAAIEHVPEPERVFAEIARVLRPGGAALLAPAWHCRTWAAEGLDFQPYSRLRPGQRVRKALIPLRENLLLRAASELPLRIAGELRLRRGAMPLRYGRLTPNLDEFVGTDSDAFSSLDPHAAILWFISRGWSAPSHPTRRARMAARNGMIVVQKPR